MKKLFLIGAAVLSLGLVSITAQANAANTKERAMELTNYNKDGLAKGPEAYFTGNVTIGSMFSSGGHDSYKGASVNFEAGARTAWHTHPRGQTLVITSGEGRAQTEGEPVHKLKPGDVVWIPAGERHWHGAAPNSPMSHIAIHSPDENGDAVTWMEKVTDEEYMVE